MTTGPIVCGGHVVLGYQTYTGFGSFTPVSGTRVNVGSTCGLTALGWRILVGGSSARQSELAPALVLQASVSSSDYPGELQLSNSPTITACTAKRCLAHLGPW